MELMRIYNGKDTELGKVKREIAAALTAYARAQRRVVSAALRYDTEADWSPGMFVAAQALCAARDRLKRANRAAAKFRVRP